VYWLQLSNLARSEAEAQAMRDLSREMNERSGLLMSASTLCLIALVRGDTDTALHLSQEILPVAADLRHTLGRLVALVVQATVAALNGETAQALGLLRAVGDASHDLVSYFVGWAAALALSAAGDTDGTGAHLRESLGYALDVQGAGVVAWCLPPAALLAARDGDEAQVLSLTTLIEATELCPWAALWQPYARLRESLTVQPEKAVSLAALMAAGGMLRASLSSAHEENGRFPAHVQAANAALHEPLSERELEVLSLIAGGLQNQEIADQLVVGVSTVKKHISHIYGKLGVTTRTQALLRARELGLG
jgi:ATP/maltotriose-dependent transcriptional regulator MalT